MNSESPQNEASGYEIPCRLLPVTEFDMTENIAPEKLADIPVGGFVRDEVVHEAVEWDFSEADQAECQPEESPSNSEYDMLAEECADLIEQFSKLKGELDFSEAASQFAFVTSRTVLEKRFAAGGGLPDIDTLGDAIGEIIALTKQFSPYVAMGLWLVQVMFNRRHRLGTLIAQVVGMLRERGFTETECAVIKKMTKMELRRSGIPEEKAEWGANQVVEKLVQELPPQVTEDREAIQQMTSRIQELIAFFPGWKFEEQQYGCRVQVMLGNNRRQCVHVISKGTDKAGHQVVEFQAVCGKANPAFLRTILHRGARLEFGVFSIRKNDDSEYFVLQHRLRAADVRESALNRILPYLAEQADQAKAEMGA